MNSLVFVISRIFSLRLLIVVLTLAFVFMGKAIPMLGWADRILFGSLGNPFGIADASALLTMPPEAFASALEARGVSEPAWSAVAIRSGLMASALFLVLAVPRLGAGVALPVILLVAGSLVVLQAALMFYRNAWLPLGEVVTLLVAGYVIMLFWLQPRRDIVALSENVQEARTRLGKLLLQQGQADEALEVLSECPPARIPWPCNTRLQSSRSASASTTRPVPPIGRSSTRNASTGMQANAWRLWKTSMRRVLGQ
ncbi:MAG: hypothetical protein ABR522_10095 [Marinobacter sp.]